MSLWTDELARCLPKPHGLNAQASVLEEMAAGYGLPFTAAALRNTARQMQHLPARIEMAFDAIWANRENTQEAAYLAALQAMESE
jgi:hypothetical protein